MQNAISEITQKIEKKLKELERAGYQLDFHQLIFFIAELRNKLPVPSFGVTYEEKDRNQAYEMLIAYRLGSWLMKQKGVDTNILGHLESCFFRDIVTIHKINPELKEQCTLEFYEYIDLTNEEMELAENILNTIFILKKPNPKVLDQDTDNHGITKSVIHQSIVERAVHKRRLYSHGSLHLEGKRMGLFIHPIKMQKKALKSLT